MGRERKRVVYVPSVPEWFGYAVHRLFYRRPDWLICRVDDPDSRQRLLEYPRATYFFVSGYGHPDDAREAHAQGCILVGVRADLGPDVPVVQCHGWNPIEVFVTLRLLEWKPESAMWRGLLSHRPPKLPLEAIHFAALALRTLRREGMRGLGIKLAKFLQVRR